MTTSNIAAPNNCVSLECSEEVKGFGRLIQAFSSKTVSRIAKHIKTRRQQRIDRDAFLHLLRLDERELDDIGLTRDDVIQASNMPLSYNAALELENRKYRNH